VERRQAFARHDGVTSPYRKISSPAFRAEQHRGIRLPHIAPFTDLIDELRTVPGRGWMPYLAPMYGGVNARVLSILQDPGPGTHDKDGSGMLCVENDDDAAELYATLLDQAGIPAAELLPWNAYPWYRHKRGSSNAPTGAELDAGIEPLRRLIALAPQLRVVMLHGGSAHKAWDRFNARHRPIARPLRIIRTFHTAKRTFIAPADVREERRRHLRESFAEVAEILRAEDAA
jgi:hypothetical protein